MPQAPQTILVIDDEPLIRNSFRDYLEDSGYQVVEAENGRLGIEAYSRDRPDLVLVDLRMPEMDGLEVLSALSEMDPELPVIVVSGTGVISDAIEAVRRGAWDYLLKPILDMDALRHAVEKGLERARLLSENRRYQMDLEVQVQRKTEELTDANRELRQFNSRLTNLVDSMKRITACTHLPQMGRPLLEEFISNVGAEGGVLYMCSSSGLERVYALGMDEAPVFVDAGKGNGSLLARCLRERVPLADECDGADKGVVAGLSCVRGASLLAFPLLDERGEALGVVGLRSMTDRPFTSLDEEMGKILASYSCEAIRSILTTNELVLSEEKYRLLVNNASQGIIVIQNGLVQFANPKVLRLSGYDFDEIRSSPFTMAVHREDRKLVTDQLAQRMEGGEVAPYSIRIRRKDGMIRWMEVTGVLFEWEGEPATLIFLNDVTERVMAERALFESERQYRDLVENLREGVWLLDNGGRTVFVNQSLGDMLGMAPEEVIGFSPASFTDDHGREVFGRYMHGGDTLGRGTHEIALQSRSGKEIIVALSVCPLWDDKGERNGLLAGVVEITERKRMEAELRKAKSASDAANQAKSEFLANMSHEIRTPLNGVLGMLQLMELTPMNEEQEDYIRTAITSGRSLLTVINDVLNLSQVEAGIVELRDQPLELEGLLQSVLKAFQHDAEGRGIYIHYDMDESVPEALRGDEGRIRQVLFNIVGNAIKFTDHGGVTVEVSRLPFVGSEGGVRLLFSVHDTGIGIPDDMVGTVFQAFTQVDGSYTRKYQGAGLGLGIVKRLVELMDGTITVDSEQGVGTSIYFTIHLRPSLEDQDAVAVQAAPSAQRRNLRVLVAEDDKVNQLTIRRFLERLGHKAVLVDTGREAVESLSKGAFDCVLMDIQMPDMNGLEATRAIRSSEGLGDMSRVPIVALTAHAMSGDKEVFLEAGMNDYIAKPVSLEDLKRILQANAL